MAAEATLETTAKKYANSPRIAEGKVVVELQQDLRTHALIQILGLPEEEKDHGHYVSSQLHEVSSFLSFVPTFAVLAVSFLQLLMAWSSFGYVRNNMILTLRNPLLTSYEMFVGSNVTLPYTLTVPLCGDYDDQDMHADTKGPLSHITMPDGSVYKANDDYDMFYQIRSPFRELNYAKLGIEDRSVMDNTLYVIHEGLTFNPFGDGAGYSLLFILMMAMWLFAVLIEYRQLFHNATVFLHFENDPSAEHNFELNESEDKFRLVKLTTRARLVLFINLFTRWLVATALLFVGCFLLTYTTAKIDLILNALALLFIIEIDQILFYATVSGAHQRHIDDIEPIEIELPHKSLSLFLWSVSATLMPIIPFCVNFFAAACLRMWQLQIFRGYFKLTAALCLFAGAIPNPQPDLMAANLMAPVPGFCDSLLGVTCAPDVTPAETSLNHGYCVITDQRVATVGSTFLYLDDPKLFEGRGGTKSWIEWGEGSPELYDTAIWNFGPYQDIMRKNCLQMYQKTGVPEDRMVDEDDVLVARGAPFWCSRDELWKAVFGKFTEGREAATDITMSNMDLVADLDDPAVVKAVDACGSTPPLSLSTQERVQRRVPRTHHRRAGRKQHKLHASKAASVAPRHEPSSARIAEQVPVGPPDATAGVKETVQPKPISSDQKTGGHRKKLGPAGMLEIARPQERRSVSELAQADISSTGDVSRASSK